MATYYRGFEDADGISDFTETELVSGHTAPAWSIVSSNQVQATSTNTNSEALLWNDIDGDANRANFEILGQVLVNSTSTTQRWFAGRVSSSLSRTAYSVRVRTTSIDVYHSVGGTYTVIAGATISITSGTWCWVRFRVNSTGNIVRARVWADGDGEPGTWTVDTTDSTYTNAGGVGLLKGNNTNTQLWRRLGVGTNGDTAPDSAGGANMAASVSASASPSAALTTVIRAAASVSGSATVSASLTTSVSMAASVSGTATTSADLTAGASGAMAAAVIGQATASAALTTAIRMQASVAASAATTADLTTAASALAAAVTAQASASAALTTAIRMAALANASASASAAMSGGTAVRLKVYVPPLNLPKNVSTTYDRELQQAIKAWADRTTQLINDLASRIP